MLARLHGPPEAFGVIEKMPPSRNYQCVTCLKNFSAPSKLQRHILTHTGQRPFGCHLCEKAFRQLAHLKLHLNTHLYPKHIEQKKLNVKSTQGPTGFGNDSSIKTNNINACLKTVGEEETLEVGISPSAPVGRAQEISLSSSQCIAENLPHSEIERFEKEHTEEETLRNNDDWRELEKQTLDEDRATKDETMDKHGKIQNMNSHKCPECLKSFSAPSKLKRHCLIHTGQKPFQCYLCHRAFRQLAHLKVHYSIHSRAPKMNKPSLSRNRLMSLSQPQRENTWQRNYPCNMCGKRFKQKRRLVVHQQTHNISEAAVQFCRLNRMNNVPPHTDSASQVEFKISDSSISGTYTELNRKMPLNDVEGYSNLPEKWHNCEKRDDDEQCDLTFSSDNQNNKSSVSNGTNQINPSKIQDNQCMICLKMFDYPSKLSRHLLVHMDIKPFGCTVCTKSFRQLCHLQTHMKAHYARNNHGAKGVQNGPDQPRVIQYKEKLVSDVKRNQSENLDHVPELQEDSADVNVVSDFQSQYVQHVRPGFSQSSDHFDVPQPAWTLSGKGLPELDCDIKDRKSSLEPDPLRQEQDTEYTNSSDVLASTPSHQLLKGINQLSRRILQKKPTVYCGGRYCCPVCSKRFDAPSKLHRHSLIHTGQRSFQCPVCPKRFRQKAHLKVHNSVHEHEKEAKTLTSRSDDCPPLSRQTKCECSNEKDSVFGEKTSSCSDISGVPPSQSNCTPTNSPDSQPLPSAVPRRSGGYQCMACLKTFDYPSKLSRHLLVHMGIKPYTCIICTKSFRQLCHLQSHMKLHRKAAQYGDAPHKKSHSTAPPPEETPGSEVHLFTADLYQEQPHPSEMFGNEEQYGNHKRNAGESYAQFCSTESTNEMIEIDKKHEPTVEPLEDIKIMKSENSFPLEQECTMSPHLVKSSWNMVDEKHVEKIPSDEYYVQQNQPQLPNWLSPFPYDQETSKNKEEYPIPSCLVPYLEGRSIQVEHQEIPGDVDQKLNVYSPPLTSNTKAQYRAKEEAGLEAELGSEINVTYKSEPPNDLHVCTDCSQCFATKRKLIHHRCSQRHLEKERQAGAYQCAICFKSFEAPSKLKRHYVIHTGQRPFECTVCGKAFTQAGHLKTHLQTHR